MAKILAVDDEPAILEMIESILNKDGHLATKVSNPLKLNMEELHRYDLILLELMASNYAKELGYLWIVRFCFLRQKRRKTVW